MKECKNLEMRYADLKIQGSIADFSGDEVAYENAETVLQRAQDNEGQDTITIWSKKTNIGFLIKTSDVLKLLEIKTRKKKEDAR